MLILFLTRIGASFVEIMSESYFFKQAGVHGVDVISFFRNNRPVSYVIAPLVAMRFLSVFSFQYLFLILGVVMIIGLKYSLTLKDAR